jgi:hypothetical protein
VPYGRGEFGHQGGAQLVQLVIGLGQRRYGGLPGSVMGSRGEHEGVLMSRAAYLTAVDRNAGDDWPGSAVAAAFADAVESGRLSLPLPGGGRTRERWAVLADLAGEDLSLARLAEGHADALAELGHAAPPGGAREVGRTLLAAAAEREIGPHALAHLGAVDVALSTAKTVLDVAAGQIDTDPDDRRDGGRRRALRVRAFVETVSTEVMQRVGRALGAGPLCHDEAHSRRVADLTVYLRQHHAERNLAELGALVADSGTSW